MQDREIAKGKIRTFDLVRCGLFAALLAVGAFLKIVLPIGPFLVTFSLQFFFALLAGFLLGAKQGALSVLVYLLIGLLGAPVFAHGGGPSYLLRPTFGFLLGFLAAAFVAGALTEHSRKRVFGRFVFAGFLAECAYYLIGLVYYFLVFNFVLTDGSTIGIAELLSVWCVSTFLPDFSLVLLSAFAAARLSPFLAALRGDL